MLKIINNAIHNIQTNNNKITTINNKPNQTQQYLLILKTKIFQLQLRPMFHLSMTNKYQISPLHHKLYNLFHLNH